MKMSLLESSVNRIDEREMKRKPHSMQTNISPFFWLKKMDHVALPGVGADERRNALNNDLIN